jgi:hypothetical protein
MIPLDDIIKRHLQLAKVKNATGVSGLLSNTNLSKYIQKVYNEYIPQYGGSKIPAKFDLSKPRKILEDDEIDVDTRTIDITHNEIKYRFNIVYTKYLNTYKLYQLHSKEASIPTCIVITIEKKPKEEKKKDIKKEENENICYIQSIAYNKNCMPRLEMNNKGSTLLKIALKLIRLLKDRYKIKTIELTDNSKKTCKGKEIKLSTMLTLLTGTTWYGKYGFYPKDKEYKSYFDENKKIIAKTMLSDIPQLKELIIKAHKKSETKLDLDSILISYKIALNKKASLQSFLNWFLKEYDNRCEIFFYFYNKLYRELKLTDMYGETFVKDI